MLPYGTAKSGFPEFMDAWCALGPTHHVALGLGHRLADISKVVDVLGMPLETV